MTDTSKVLKELSKMPLSSFKEDCAACLNKLYMYEQIGKINEIREALAEAEAIKRFGQRLPCKLGDPVFRLMTYCNSKDFFYCNKEDCNKCLDAEYKLEECKFQYNMLDTWGEEFFATEENGEKRIKELQCLKCKFRNLNEHAYDGCAYGCSSEDKEEEKACYKRDSN